MQTIPFPGHGEVSPEMEIEKIHEILLKNSETETCGHNVTHLKCRTENREALFAVLDIAIHAGIISPLIVFSVCVAPKQETYQDYLDSPEWKAKARAAKKRAGNRCQVCNASGVQLDTHHRTYERLRAELDEDLIVLCHDCHTIFHTNGKLAR